jgi:hypothetical protein
MSHHRGIIVTGGACFIGGALAFVAVFSYLAANFGYPDILDGSAAEVLPRLQGGGATMRSVWALYAFLPLLLIPGAISAFFACPASRGRMSIATMAAALGALAMCLGLMRWPSLHWMLAEAYGRADPDTQASLSAVFNGMNVYLGKYIGEFLGEMLLGLFFLLTGLSMRIELPFPKWLGWGGIVFAVLFMIGAFRNVTPLAQPVADLNNSLLPLWMIVLGITLIRRGATQTAA